jgi:purine nucleosidase
MKHRIVLDTDMGTDVDDALCLALAVASPEIELVAVTTVSGDSRLRAHIARRLLELAGRDDVPVFAGEQRTRSGGDSFAWHGGEGEGILSPGISPRIEGESAPRAIVRLLRAETDLELVAVGPMTNVAAVLDQDPSLATRCRRLTIMGGHVRAIEYRGHTFAHGVDYNLCSDPEASLQTLRAPFPTSLVTGDVTLQTWIRPEDLARIAAAATPFHRAIELAVRHWTPIQRRIFGDIGARIGDDNVAFLHDPLALACVHDESFCDFEDLAIEPAVRNGVFRTLEVAPSPAARVMRCAVAVDAARFREHFVERVAAFRPHR